MIELVEFTHQDREAWKALVAQSNNGTLFHDLEFLSYHPAERFATRHLLFKSDGQIVGLFPAAVIKEARGEVLRSPYGASIGGLVLPVDTGLSAVSAMIALLKQYAQTHKLVAIEMRIGPALYARKPDDVQSFALSAAGFVLAKRWLTHVIPLYPDLDRLDEAIPKRKRDYIRAAEKRGLKLVETTAAQLEPFYQMLCDNRQRFGATPTHSLSELQDLMARLPQRIRLFLCPAPDDVAQAAGTVVFELNDQVAYNFYPCHAQRFESLRPALFLGYQLARYYAARGFTYFDLGPSTFEDYSINQGLVSFKESLGARGHCRDRWRWDA